MVKQTAIRLRSSVRSGQTMARPVLTGLADASIVEPHAHLVRLPVEFALNHPLERSLVELVRRVEQVLGIEVGGPMLRERIGTAKIHGRAGRIPNVHGFLAADRE